MQLTKIAFNPMVDIEFTDEEFRALIVCSQKHCDYKCNQASGPVGFLTRWYDSYKRRDILNIFIKTTTRISIDHIDTMIKITEIAHTLSNDYAGIGIVIHFELQNIWAKIQASEIGPIFFEKEV